MGGIPTNYKGEVLSDKDKNVVEGLYSVGEAACVSVHGANRLGANSLLDLVVFGRSCGMNIVDKMKNDKKNVDNLDIDYDNFNKSLMYINNLINENENKENKENNNINSNSGNIRSIMQESMQKYASVYKSEDLLQKGFDIIKDLTTKKITIKDKSIVWNTDLIEALELRNMISLAYVTVLLVYLEKKVEEVITDTTSLKEMMKNGCIIH